MEEVSTGVAVAIPPAMWRKREVTPNREHNWEVNGEERHPCDSLDPENLL